MTHTLRRTAFVVAALLGMLAGTVYSCDSEGFEEAGPDIDFAGGLWKG